MQASRKVSRMVDVQLDDFQIDLREHIDHQLFLHTQYDLWYETDELSSDNLKNIDDSIDHGFREITTRYSEVKTVTNILEHYRILMKCVIKSAMNVPFPVDANAHIARVVDNAFDVYYTMIFPHLRSEMIMVNSHCEVVQRTWRRCNCDPQHPVCRRRLLREFEDMVTPKSF